MIHDLVMMERRAMHNRLTPGCHVSAEQDSDAVIFNRATNLPARLAIEINELSFLIKQAGLWEKVKAILPFIGCDFGGSYAASKDLRRPTAVTSFAGGWTFSKTGAKPNGTNATFNTGWGPGANITPFSSHIAFYSRTQNTNSGYYMGVNSLPSNSSPRLNLYFLTPDTIRSYSQTLISGVSAEGSSTGFLLISRTANNVEKIFRGATQLGSTITTTVTGSYPTASMFIGAANSGGGVGQAFGDKEGGFACMGDGLTDAEVAKLNTIVQSYATRLCRTA